MNIQTGSSYHGLKLLSCCGGGAYGEVYYCEDISGRKLAVKIVSKQKLGDHWERELRGVSYYRRITENAPYLLQIYHVEEDEETFFYTMEAADSVSEKTYVPDTLAHRLQSGPLPQEDLFRILSGIFEAIKTIHQAGFTHRDIKPDNILFVRGVPKLADIGLLSSLSSTMTLLAGTLDFLPPEERSAESPDSSDRQSRQRNDLYAFGKVVYCAVTGLNPGEYPTIPGDLPLSLPLKYFSRLAFRLCNKDPLCRLDSIDELDSELQEIKRKLLYGETFRDRVNFQMKEFGLAVKNLSISALRLLKYRWYLMLLFLLLGGGIAYAIFKPPEPFDITRQKTKPYRNEKLQISMQIPSYWEIFPEKIMKDHLETGEKNDLNGNKFTPEQIEIISSVLKNNQNIIFCDIDRKFADNVMIYLPDVTREEWGNLTEDEIRLYLKALINSIYGNDTKIFAVKKTTFRHFPCLFADYSPLPGIRTISYDLDVNGKILTLALTAKNETFQQRQMEFLAMLESLKVEK